ncbi:MAG TPA: type II toxin-antitoxin system PemK/MazF family toxin [Bacillota bacterium]|jgi:mRNA interferase MazF
MTLETRRGEIWLVDWNPSRGSEQAGVRPALVVQNDIGNRCSTTTIVAAVSTRKGKAYPFQVPMEPPEGGLSAESIIKLDQVMTVATERLVRKLGSVGRTTMARVDEALRWSLSLG